MLRFHGVEELFAECGGRGRCILDVEQEQGAETDGFVEGADRIDIASDGVVVYLGQRDEGEDEGRESDSNDLALFFGSAIAAQVHEDESETAD